ncbi:C40 family peptidase [Leeia aquatica]|uniref:C40 family peptidase n=1 Tax=Leeia aquatica TaxID=2725557 RepID=A0A847S847_9NEIS|nr:C40 family peptidase [Leeia aquatica]NLR75933.1 C40 family peptidase [Leeia aquatica]
MKCYSKMASIALAALLLAGCPSRTPPATSSSKPVPVGKRVEVASSHREEVTLYALGLLNTEYRYGGSSPEGGLDCSGLVSHIFAKATGVLLPHNAAAIASLARPLERSALQAGDLVFFNTLGRPFSHMGVYLGEDKFIHAPSSGKLVRIDLLSNRYYASRFEGGRTLFQ